MSDNQRKLARALFYTRNIVRDASLQSIFRARLPAILATADRYSRSELAERVSYYNKLSAPLGAEEYKATVASIPIKSSLYYYDLKEHARYFPRRFGLNFEFGDIIRVPARPSFVKSRPIRPDNQNSILMKLNKFRHFYFPPDPVAFADKRPQAVWRGISNNPLRKELVSRYRGHALADVAFSNRKARGAGGVMHLSEASQMAYRYIISIEGNDVGTNTKWIFASNSVCMMPRPTVETWFMEGRVEPGVHYVELRRDFADLEEKIRYFEANPADARQIVANANAWARTFRDEPRERLISLLVMAKYFVLTGQLEPDPRIADLIGPLV
jgi:hypothetical protein